MRTSSLLVVPVAVLGLFALTACGDDAETVNSATTSAAGGESASPTAGPSTSPATDLAAAYAPITDPESESDEVGLDFGRLTKITTKDGVITLHINREKYYAGDDATAHNKGKAPLDGYLIEDTDGDKLLSFTLDPKASIQVTAGLSSNGEQVEKAETLSPAELIKRMDKLDPSSDPDANTNPLVWLRHADGADGPVTALVDQFTP